MLTVSPVCKAGQVTTYYVARKELIQIPCELEAYPNAGMDFFWSFNGSRDISDIPGSTYVSDRLRSSLTYQPVTEQVPITAYPFSYSFLFI